MTKRKYTGEYIEIPIELSIDKLFLTKGTEISINLESEDLLKVAKAELAGETKLICEAQGQKINIILWLRDSKKDGTFNVKLIPTTEDSNIVVIPSEIALTLKLKYAINASQTDRSLCYAKAVTGADTLEMTIEI